MKCYYTIEGYIDDIFVNKSDIFFSKKDALILKNKLESLDKTNTINYYLVKSKSINSNYIINNNSYDIDKDTDKIFKNYSLYLYSKGYLINYTIKNKIAEYFLKKIGTWLNDVNGYYIKKNKKLSYFKKLGIYVTNERIKIKYEYNCFLNKEVIAFRDGYFLVPKKNDNYYGNYNYKGGIWNKQYKAWFFKRGKYKKLIKFGGYEQTNSFYE